MQQTGCSHLFASTFKGTQGETKIQQPSHIQPDHGNSPFKRAEKKEEKQIKWER